MPLIFAEHEHDSTNSCCYSPFQGTLDLLLITEDGWERAHVALKWMYEQLRTPGSLFYISHSPPHDRVAMLTSVYWHDAQVREPVAQALAIYRACIYRACTNRRALQRTGVSAVVKLKQAHSYVQNAGQTSVPRAMACRQAIANWGCTLTVACAALAPAVQDD